MAAGSGGSTNGINAYPLYRRVVGSESFRNAFLMKHFPLQVMPTVLLYKISIYL